MTKKMRPKVDFVEDLANAKMRQEEQAAARKELSALKKRGKSRTRSQRYRQRKKQAQLAREEALIPAKTLISGLRTLLGARKASKLISGDAATNPALFKKKLLGARKKALKLIPAELLKVKGFPEAWFKWMDAAAKKYNQAHLSHVRMTDILEVLSERPEYALHATKVGAAKSWRNFQWAWLEIIWTYKVNLKYPGPNDTPNDDTADMPLDPNMI